MFFCCVVEEGFFDLVKVVQIGICGMVYDSEDCDFVKSVGICVILIEEYFERGVVDVMVEVKVIVVVGLIYVFYDIDFVDLVFVFGIGMFEVGGLGFFEVLLVVCQFDGVNIVGVDFVEVFLLFDQVGGIVFFGVLIMFEILCNMVMSIVLNEW